MTTTFAQRLKDDIAALVADPSPERLQQLIRFSGGEFDQYELKREWPPVPRIARTVLGIANSGGGVVIFGIEDESLAPVGLDQYTAKQQVFDIFRRFIPPELIDDITLLDVDYTDAGYLPLKDKRIQVIVVPNLPALLPFIAEDEWHQDDGHIRRGGIYVRRGTSTIEASYRQVRELIRRHVSAVTSHPASGPLARDLEELRELTVARERARSTDGASPEDLAFLEELIREKRSQLRDRVLQPSAVLGT